MVSRLQIRNNAVLSVAQVCVNAISLFFVYRYLLVTFGVEKMGVWSIVMVFATIAKIGDFGFAGGVTRFVAKYNATGDRKAMHQVVETGAISLTVLFGLAALLMFLTATLFLPKFFSQSELTDAQALLPFSIASFALTAVAGVFLSALDGMQRADRRNLIQIVATLAYTILAYVCTRYGNFIGIGYAQLGQSLILLLMAWVAAKKLDGMEKYFPTRWSFSRFKEMLSYNANLQVSVLSSLLLDPVSKLLLGHWGTLEMTGYFEMASKLVAQFRAVMVSINQTLVPVIAQLNEKSHEQVVNIYATTYSALFFVSLTFYTCAGVSIPLISEVWLGSTNYFFIYTAYLILFSMFVNTLTGPAYFSNQGTGKVRLNTEAQLLMGFANISLAFLCGRIFGGVGIIVAYAAAVVIGSSYLLIRFMKINLIVASSVIPLKTRLFSSVCSAVLAAAVATVGLMSSFVLQARYALTAAVLVCLLFFAVRSSAFSEIYALVKIKKA